MFSEEFEKHDKKMTALIEELKVTLESAENEGVEVIDGTTYPTSHLWRSVAELALELANKQEWFDRDYDRENNNSNLTLVTNK